MPSPKNVKELKTLLGMANYMQKFVPNMSEITAPLRVLEKKGVLWHWE